MVQRGQVENCASSNGRLIQTSWQEKFQCDALVGRGTILAACNKSIDLALSLLRDGTRDILGPWIERIDGARSG